MSSVRTEPASLITEFVIRSLNSSVNMKCTMIRKCMKSTRVVLSRLLIHSLVRSQCLLRTACFVHSLSRLILSSWEQRAYELHALM